MRSLSFVTAAALALSCAITASASAQPICLDVHKIDNVDSKDGKVLLFHMHDGRVLRNHLKSSCDDLRFSGFAWGVESSDNKVCEDSQTLTTLTNHQTCTMGKFETPVPTAK